MTVKSAGIDESHIRPGEVQVPRKQQIHFARRNHCHRQLCSRCQLPGVWISDWQIKGMMGHHDLHVSRKRAKTIGDQRQLTITDSTVLRR